MELSPLPVFLFSLLFLSFSPLFFPLPVTSVFTAGDCTTWLHVILVPLFFFSVDVTFVLFSLHLIANPLCFFPRDTKRKKKNGSSTFVSIVFVSAYAFGYRHRTRLFRFVLRFRCVSCICFVCGSSDVMPTSLPPTSS